ncbi:50S ribosomal protein L2 [bacterium (Candidatus Gribaldobacteria) CG08_land_8_20_14_0_20_39_15]|uniref:Large ribosomal subunit protein uL2 n=1 Tax=bacterium (Candidatus Gribaldobacteria) CG08_land_8_20_14_0_20_39_15 TaxID=2014273 RepID=A0A2M6XV06_9BACT|nr:MAG: 50S ribosomal protein L2 [bacterium (Candidatus Gribaldobacteria) CG08_land_8_20_14_0_20_39_15]
MSNVIFTKKEPEKGLIKILKKYAGRNNTGRITVRHQGGRVKRYYRCIEFAQPNLGDEAKVISIEYDPNRTCYIALIQYESGCKQYILSPQGIKLGDKIVCAEKAPLNPGNRIKLKNAPVGAMVHNIELIPGMGGKLSRSAGSFAQVMAQEGKYANLKMPSGEVRRILGECFVSVGSLSNPEHRFRKLGKAGISRLKGRRPSVRGSAMNACDHPHGGGKNKQPIGRHPRTPWGKPALGVKTRRSKWTDKLILQRRVNKKRK